MEEDNKNIDFEDNYEEEDIEQTEQDIGEFNSFSFGYNIATIIDFIQKKIIDINPNFQRQFVWDIKKSSKLIESILLGIPIPNIILGQNKKSQDYIVIDGQQRLKSIYYYVYENKFIDENGERDFKLNLKTKNKEDNKWHDIIFNKLDEIDKMKLRNYVLNATVIQYEGDMPKVVR